MAYELSIVTEEEGPLDDVLDGVAGLWGGGGWWGNGRVTVYAREFGAYTREHSASLFDGVAATRDITIRQMPMEVDTRMDALLITTAIFKAFGGRACFIEGDVTVMLREGGKIRALSKDWAEFAGKLQRALK